ncbi:mitochondrial matrix iron-sulfur protein [Coemansia javaensis]|uniref:Mitochondrial matrix iron-sulfur protein n=1 Tax=Coemansia javaensis TaxID=2761396 RepID=A0A9W8LJ06_9FUNG|nr:mitochondrial matrix iron-sulfur protein [Coemansia javaensis]
MAGALVRSTVLARLAAASSRVAGPPPAAAAVGFRSLISAGLRSPPVASFSSSTPTSFRSSAAAGKSVTVTFIEPDGNEIQATGEEGTNLMELAHENDVDLEGACEGACACSTCHVILEDKIFDGLPEPTDEENDMLDLAFGLTDTSRLGCQVLLTPEMEGMRIKLPSATRNFYVDGAKPAHH